jgi:predicted metal-dependent phosphoesterase TrpH
MIDLHIHTTASDGTYSPEDIMDMAGSLCLDVISITDHDTLEGVQRLVHRGDTGLPELLTGVEISTQPPENLGIKESFHLLGYRVDPFNKELNEELLKLQNARKNRNPSIIEKLKELGFDISLDKVKELSGDVQLGRAHIGRYLYEKGYVSSVEEAFRDLLGNGKPAYVEKYRIPVKDAIKKVKEAGGVPVLAHPGLIKGLDEEGYQKIFEILKDYGLEGLEVLYPAHSESMRSFLKEECKRLGFIYTGGSDFHGYKDEGLELGKGRDNLYVPYSVYKSILTR